MIRFSRAHTASVLLMSACALLAILVSQTLGPVAGALLPALFVLASLNALLDEPKVVLPSNVGASLSVLLVLYSGVSLRNQQDISGVASTFAGYLLVLRILTRDSARSDMQLAVLSLFAFLSVALLTPSVDYGAFLLVYVLITPVALALTHLRGAVERNERSGAKDKAGVRVDLGRILRSKRVLNKHFWGLSVLLVAPIVLGTLFVFFLFPRVGLAAVQLQLNNNRSRIGFSSDVVLSSTATPETDSTVALRLRPPARSSGGPPPAPYLGAYMRGAVATTESVDGMRSDAPPSLPSASSAQCTRDVVHDLGAEDLPLWTVDSTASEQTYLFVPLGHTRVTLQKPDNGCLAERPSTHELATTPTNGGSRYVFTGDPGASFRRESLSSEAREALLRLSEVTRRALAPVRKDFAAGDTAHAAASAIEAKFRATYTYDLASPSRQAAEPLADFLANSHRGHCEFFAAAMALLLRDQGIPARVVTGYLGGEYNSYGAFYTFRQSDAHAWVEAYIDAERQWVRFDPTPAAPGSASAPREPSAAREFYEASSAIWQRYFVSYDLRRQQDLVDRASQSLGSAAGSSSASGMLATLRTLSTKKVLAGVAVLVLLVGLARRRGGAPTQRKQSRAAARVAAQGGALERALTCQGFARTSEETIAQFARRVAHTHAAADALTLYAHSYEELRYGDAELSPARSAALAQWLRQIRTAP